MHNRCLALFLALAGAGAGASPEPRLASPYRITPRAGGAHIALDRDWRLGWRDAQVKSVSELASHQKWIGVAVPTSVHMALYRAGELPHPYYNLNSEKYRWAERKVWYYRKSFTVPESARGRYAMLSFDGISYYARVWLNGQLLGQHEGMLTGPTVEVSKWLRYGQDNDLVVEVRSGNWERWDVKFRSNPGSVMMPWVFAGGTAAEAFYVFGMWRGARIEILPEIHLERPFLMTEFATAAEARLRLSVELLVRQHSGQFAVHLTGIGRILDHVNSHSARKAPAGLAVKIEMKEAAGGRVAYSAVIPAAGALEGRNWIEKSFTVPAPKLWWPNGMGEPNLYRVTLTLLDGGRAIDSLAFDYGIRTIATTRSAGPRTADIWHNWQFSVNGRKLFIKGVNWMPADLLLDLPRERYEWLIDMAKAAGIQMFRIWGAGLVETEDFYDLCNRRGIMVWQDFTVSNIITPEWPQDFWEEQVIASIFRIRNHPSLALYCGGNESNPYHTGNAASIGIFERSVAEFDGTRAMRRTSPDGGSMHTYPDKDPTWYGKEHKLIPYFAETGMHNIPEARSMREVVDAAEFARPLSNMFSPSFVKEHPDFRHHFGEFVSSRVPRMLSRASQVDDMSQPTIEALADASQMGAAEFYQIVSEQVQANYPVTTGLMPWVYKRPWPIIAIMLADAFGQPTAPYYFLKRTYEPTHVSLFLPEILWAKGESVPLDVKVMHAPPAARAGLTVSVEVFDGRLASLWRKSAPVAVKAGPSVNGVSLGSFTIPDRLRDRYFFLVAELRDTAGALVSRSVYWPRCLAMMEDEAFRTKYRASPQPALTFDRGPWLKPTVAAAKTALRCEILEREEAGPDRARLRVRVRNAGSVAAFPVQFDIHGVKRAFFATENYFWLKPGETREVRMDVLWREAPAGKSVELAAWAWNAAPVVNPLAR